MTIIAESNITPLLGNPSTGPFVETIQKEVSRLAKKIYMAEAASSPAILREQLSQKLLSTPTADFDSAKEKQLSGLLPEDVDSALVNFVDSFNLPEEHPPSNLYGKHLVSYFQRITAGMSENQKRLYAAKIINHKAFHQRLIPAEQKAALANLGLSSESYARLKKDLPESQQSAMGSMIDALAGSNLAVAPYGHICAQNGDRKPMTAKNWVNELQTSACVLSGMSVPSITGTHNELITLQDAQAIVRVFSKQTLSISGYSITSEAFDFIKAHAPSIQCYRVEVQNRPAQNNGKILQAHELDQKWKNVPKDVVYQIKSTDPAQYDLPLIDEADAKKIIETNVRPIITGYAITWDALSVFNQNSINIDLSSNLIVNRLESSLFAFRRPNDWAQKMKGDDRYSAHKTVFDELNKIEQLHQSLESTNTLLLITKKPETIGLEDARCIASNLQSSAKTLKLIGYTLTKAAAEYFKTNASNVIFQESQIIPGTDPVWIRDNSEISFKEQWKLKITLAERRLHTAYMEGEMKDTGLEIVPANKDTVIDYCSAQALALAINETTQPIELVEFWLTKPAAEYLKGFPKITFQQKQIITDRDLSFERSIQLSGKWAEALKNKTVPLRQFIKDIKGSYPVIDKDEVMELMDNCKIKDVSDQLQLSGYAITEDALAMLLQTFPSMELDYTHSNLIITGKIPKDVKYPDFGEILTSSAKLDGVLAAAAQKENFSIVDDENAEALISALQQLYPNQRVVMPGYTVTEDVVARLEPFVDLRFCHIIPASPKAERNWAVIFQNTQFPRFGALVIPNINEEVAVPAENPNLPTIDKENVDALLSVLQQRHPNQRAALPGYSITSDVVDRLQGYVDLRFCRIIQASSDEDAESTVRIVTKQKALSPVELERNWLILLQQDTDVLTGNYQALPFSAEDKVIEIVDAKMILLVCDQITGPISAIRGHTISQEAYDYLRINAPHIDLRLNRIAPTQNAMITCAQVGKALGMIVGTLVVAGAFVGLGLLIGQVFATILVALVLLILIAAVASAANNFAAKVPHWLYMLGLYARSLGPIKDPFKDPMQEAMEEISAPARSWIGQKLQSLWASLQPSSQALIVQG